MHTQTKSTAAQTPDRDSMGWIVSLIARFAIEGFYAAAETGEEMSKGDHASFKGIL